MKNYNEENKEREREEMIKEKTIGMRGSKKTGVMSLVSKSM